MWLQQTTLYTLFALALCSYFVVFLLSTHIADVAGGFAADLLLDITSILGKMTQ